MGWSGQAHGGIWPRNIYVIVGALGEDSRSSKSGARPLPQHETVGTTANARAQWLCSWAGVVDCGTMSILYLCVQHLRYRHQF